MSNILISFVIPSLNDRRIIECIKSIQSTNIPDDKIEIIIQDGGSSQSLINEIKSLLSKNDQLIVEQDSGIFDGINRGIRRSNGYFILSLGSDDRVFNLKYEEIKKLWASGVQVVIGELAYTDENWTPIRYWKARKISYTQYLLGRQYAHFSLLCTKEVYEQVGYFNTKNKVNADYEFFYYLCLNIKKFKQNVHNQVVTQMRIGGNSSKNIQTILRANITIFKFIFKANPLLFFGFTFKPFYKLIEYFNRNNI